MTDMKDAIIAGNEVLLNEQANLLMECEAVIENLVGHNIPTSYDGEDDEVGVCAYCQGWNMTHTEDCETEIARIFLKKLDEPRPRGVML